MPHEDDAPEFAAADVQLRRVMDEMTAKAAQELAGPKLRLPCRKVLVSLQKHWTGLTRFVDDARIPMGNNASERSLRGAALGRKNYYGSGAEWSGQLAMMLFSVFATLQKWNLNPRTSLRWYLDACAMAGGQAPSDVQPFLPWNLGEEKRRMMAEPMPAQEFEEPSVRPRSTSDQTFLSMLRIPRSIDRAPSAARQTGWAEFCYRPGQMQCK